MTIEDIAAGLGKKLGIELNVVDDSFAMDFGGMPFVVMRLDGERGEMLTVACDLGEIPPQSPGKLYEALLNANWAYRIAPSRSSPAIWGLNSESTSNSFGKVYCECTFTVTGIGTGNPQLAATKITQMFNIDPD